MGEEDGGVMTELLRELWAELSPSRDIDAEEMAQLTTRLRRELIDLDVIAVKPTGVGGVPENAKGVNLVAFGGLLVQFADSNILLSLVDTVRSWLGRQHHRSITLTLDGDSLELTGVSSAEQQRLIDLWVNRHAHAG
jgi:hypothetical protein